MVKKKICFMVVSLLMIPLSGQFDKYQYIRKIEGLSESWHSIVLPSDIYKNLTPSLNDIRIIGITSSNDTIEAPYILKCLNKVQNTEEIEFKLINQSNIKGSYFYTFEVPSKESINQIELNFGEDNFDRHVTMEGSNDQNEWFEVFSGYRILAINNENIQYKFSTLHFNPIKYNYLRINFTSPFKPNLESATLLNTITDNGTYLGFTPKKVETINNSKDKTTIINIWLDQKIPVSYVHLNVLDKIDYYRMVTIEYLNDSIKAGDKWIPLYNIIYSGTLSSLEPGDFWINNLITNRLRITISNFDNQPLTFGNVEIKGASHILITRIDKKADYFLIYGNIDAPVPQYDIALFSNKIPDNLKELTLTSEEIMGKPESRTIQPGIDKGWLYGLMALIMLILGGFTLFMIRNSKKLKE